MTNLLEVKNLSTYFETDDGVVKAVDGISFDLKRGQTLGIVGESGSGKSVTNLSIIRLIPDPPGKIVSGEVLFSGNDLLLVSNEAIRKISAASSTVIKSGRSSKFASRHRLCVLRGQRRGEGTVAARRNQLSC